MIYENLRKIREEKGYTQNDVADILDIKRQQYQLYESGKREIPSRFIKQLAAVYKVPADYILGVKYDFLEDAPLEEIISNIVGRYERLYEEYDEAEGDLKREIGAMLYKIRSHTSSILIDCDCYEGMIDDHKKNPEKILTSEEDLFFI
mgnify:CR=1 FL=1